MDETRPDMDRTGPDDETGPIVWTYPVDPTRPVEAGAMPAASRDGVTLRFGPGVPPEVARKWRDRSVRRRSLTRRVVGGLLTLGVAVLAGLLVWWLLRGGSGVTVTGVSVSAPKTAQSCDTTVRVVGTIRTDGGSGDIAYRWRRSDGQVSAMLSESVRKGRRSVQVPLRWTVKGTGTMHAVATLEVVRPGKPVVRASGAFDYACG